MILIVSSVYDKSGKDTVKQLQRSCIDFLIEHDQAIELHEVPGAVEIPVAVQHFIEKNPHKFSVVVALGLVIKGDTDHYELVTRSVTEGLTRVSLDSQIPVIQGVLACHTKKQAIDRKDLGKDFGQTALEMKHLFKD